MTGPHQSILGREIDQVMETTLTFRPTIFHVAEKDVRLHGAIVEVDPQSGRAASIRRLAVNEADAAELENAGP
jgi:calcineurin-like phosphoesterase